MRVVTTVRGLSATEPHISLTCPVVIAYTTEDDLCSIKYFRGPRYIAQRGRGAHGVVTTVKGLASTEPPTSVPTPRRGRGGLSPITPSVPPGQLPPSRVGQEMVICQSHGWHCRSFIIVAIRNPKVSCREMSPVPLRALWAVLMPKHWTQ